MKAFLGNRAFLVYLFGALAILPVIANPYIIFIGNLILIYIILALGLNLLVGFAGQFALANAAMFGIGAYGAGLLQVSAKLPFWVALPGGALIAMAIGTIIALPALKLSGLYLGLATLAFAQFTQWVFFNWRPVTHGAGGFAIPEVDFSLLSLRSDLGIYYVSWLLAIFLIALAWNAMQSRIGRAFIAIRDGEIAAQALCINLFKYKTMAFALSGFYAGVAGGLYAALLNYVAPDSFDLFQVVMQKTMVVVGGLGSIVGSILGALFLVIANEGLRQFKSAQEIAFGALLLLSVLFMPDGIVVQIRKFLPGWNERFHAKPPSALLGGGTPASPSPADGIADKREPR
jgi:branched-chain amino acid transport system permease protein